MSLTSSVRQKLIGEHRTHERDTGSPEVQVAILTEHIRQLTDHLRVHPKDYSSRRGLLAKVNRRNKLLRYLKRTDPPRYGALVTRLELRR